MYPQPPVRRFWSTPDHRTWAGKRAGQLAACSTTVPTREIVDGDWGGSSWPVSTLAHASRLQFLQPGTHGRKTGWATHVVSVSICWLAGRASSLPIWSTRGRPIPRRPRAGGRNFNGSHAEASRSQARQRQGLPACVSVYLDMMPARAALQLSGAMEACKEAN